MAAASVKLLGSPASAGVRSGRRNTNTSAGDSLPAAAAAKAAALALTLTQLWCSKLGKTCGGASVSRV